MSCHLYTGELNRLGYGLAYLGVVNGRRVRVAAHRLAFAMHYGVDPAGCVVMHACDNPGCVNPRHLRLGSQSENIRDMYAKRRGASQRPERSHKARLREEQVRAARAMASGGMSNVAIANELGVSASAVSLLVRGLTWGWVL